MKIIKDEFNSKIFKINFGSITKYEKDISINKINNVVNKANFDFIDVKIDSKDMGTLYNFQRCGFYIVDCMVTYEFNSLNTCHPNFDYNYDFKYKAEDSEVLILAKMASNVFKHNRFHSDPNLSNDLCDNYYYEWVLNSFGGYSDGVVISMLDNKPVGFITYNINKFDASTSTIVLNAIDPEYSNRGIYSNLLLKCTNELLKVSSKIRIGTQVDNLYVQRAWQKIGFKLVDVKYVLHKNITKGKIL